MEVLQLELDLWQSLEAAAQFPDTADMRSLCQVLEQTIADQPLSEQLQVGGEALVQIAAVFAARAHWFISDWESRHNPSESVIDLEDCSELFVQSLHLEMDELFEEPEGVCYPEQRRSPCKAEQSLVGEIDKAALLSFVDELELSEAELTEQVQELAHDEPIMEWVEAIQGFLSQQPLGQAVSFVELVRSLALPQVAVWLGLLHGQDWQLQQNGEFYDGAGILMSMTKT
jgi:hypothetical protein